ITADTSHLNRALIEVHVVGLMSVRRGIVAGDRNVDGSVDRDIDVDEASGKMAVPAISRAIVTGHNHVGTDQTVSTRGDIHITAQCGVAVATHTPDASHLKDALIKMNVVLLIGMGARVVFSNSDIDGVKQRVRYIDETPVEVSIATIASAVASGRDY